MRVRFFLGVRKEIRCKIVGDMSLFVVFWSRLNTPSKRSESAVLMNLFFSLDIAAHWLMDRRVIVMVIEQDVCVFCMVRTVVLSRSFVLSFGPGVAYKSCRCSVDDNAALGEMLLRAVVDFGAPAPSKGL